MKGDVFDAAVARHSRKVFTFASYLLGDAEEAEDVTQEVLIKLWQRGTEVKPDRMRAWLLQVTRNACIDQLRRRRRTAEIIALRPRDAAMIDGASSAPSPEQIVEGSQIGSSIHAALQNLTESARGVVILREIQGLSYAEISDVLHISVDSVRVTLHRARRRLRESLKEVSRDVAAG